MIGVLSPVVVAGVADIPHQPPRAKGVGTYAPVPTLVALTVDVLGDHCPVSILDLSVVLAIRWRRAHVVRVGIDLKDTVPADTSPDLKIVLASATIGAGCPRKGKHGGGSDRHSSHELCDSHFQFHQWIRLPFVASPDSAWGFCRTARRGCIRRAAAAWSAVRYHQVGRMSGQRLANLRTKKGQQCSRDGVIPTPGMRKLLEEMEGAIRSGQWALPQVRPGNTQRSCGTCAARRTTRRFGSSLAQSVRGDHIVRHRRTTAAVAVVLNR